MVKKQKLKKKMDVNHTQYGHQKSVWIRHCLTERTVSFFQKDFHKNVKMLVVSILKTKFGLMRNTFKSEAVVRRWCVKKVFLEISQKSQENTCLRVSFLIKLQAKAYNFIKNETLAQVFSCEFCEISKKTFFHRSHLVAASIKCSSRYICLFVHRNFVWGKICRENSQKWPKRLIIKNFNTMIIIRTYSKYSCIWKHVHSFFYKNQ